MNLKASYKKHTFTFLNPAGTSRGVYKSRDSWFIFISDGETTGIGECPPLPGLSIDFSENFEKNLDRICEDFNNDCLDLYTGLNDFPSVKFGFETATKDLFYGGQRKIFDNDFFSGIEKIKINGLIWMGSIEYMENQVKEKLNNGFNCLKFKIGALENDSELEIISKLREKYSASELEIRVDANGAYSPEKAKRVIDKLAKLKVHSIEQPVMAGKIKEMADICNSSPIAIALDEELIGKKTIEEKVDLLDEIKPHYLILKPALLGGFSSSDEWISIAEKKGIGWWATSALESSIGLNAIAQWVSNYDIFLPQGLGTGMIYTNNIESPLALSNDFLFYDTRKSWNNNIFCDNI
jgi:o-succinylbenzoate synthase